MKLPRDVSAERVIRVLEKLGALDALVGYPYVVPLLPGALARA